MSHSQIVSSHIAELTKAAELYYIKGLNQQNIADQLHIHRTEISRMLKEARELGIVKVSINSGIQDINLLEKYLQDTFQIDNVLVVPTNTSEQSTLDTLGLYAANYLSRLMSSSISVGLSWGSSIAKVIDNFTGSKKLTGISVVPLIGGPLGKVPNNYHANTLVHQLADKLNAVSWSLDTPALVSSEAFRNELLHNSNNSEVINAWKGVDMALVGIGSPLITDKGNWQGFYKNTNFESLLNSSNIVGDILSQPYARDGSIVPDLKDNTIALSLDELKKIPYSIGIAEGTLKTEAIIGALKGKLINTLITTDQTVIDIKKVMEQKKQKTD